MCWIGDVDHNSTETLAEEIFKIKNIKEEAYNLKI